MKFEKFISFSLFNAFILMVMATMIASCQKKNIALFGHFTDYSSGSIGRLPASTVSEGSDKVEKFQKTVDTKQIYIYCSQNAVKSKQCFEQQFNQILSEYIKEHGVLEAVHLVQIKDINSYELVKMEVEAINSLIVAEVDLQFKNLIEKRKTFCDDHSKKDYKKCLKQFIIRDSIAVLNSYQYKNGRLNGHEYLYLKKSFKSKLEAGFEQTALLKTKI